MSNVKISQLPYIGHTGYTVTDIVPFVSYINPTGTTSETKIDDLKDYILENSFFLPLSGGTVTGDTIFQSGLTATTISATTYYNLPIVSDTYWTSGTTGTESIKSINTTGLDSTGDRSVAWGNQTLASGNDSTSWGVQTSATTIGSTSQGLLTLASGDYSHAEGTGTIASGDNSHSEGYYTTAYGDSSHSEGGATQAFGNISHAEGDHTITFGNYSHSEGYFTKTGGNNGFLAISVAAGLVTLDASYGDVSTDYPAGDYLYLNDISYDDSYTTSVFIIDSTSFNGTETEILLVDTSVATSTAVVGNINLNPANWIGDQVYGAPGSHAEGSQTNAISSTSHAEGASAIAAGNYSHAEGNAAIAIGDTSHAEGTNTIASGNGSHAEGELTIAYGLSSHAEGQDTLTIGQYSHAEGNLTVAGWRAFTVTSVVAGLITISDNVDYSSVFNSGEVILDNIKYTNNAVVFTSPNFTIQLDDTTVNSGTYVSDFTNLNSPLATTTLGNGAHATGNGTKALGNYSETGGDETTAFGYGSHAEGASTQATGDASHAEGANTKTIGDYSHAEGYSTIASVPYSHAEGNQTTADGQYSHTEGFGTQTIGANSHAEGNGTIATGINSHAEGYGGETIGNSSHSEGYITTSIGDYSHSEGYGTVSGWRAFVVTSVVGGLITISDNVDYTSQFTLGGGEVILDNNLYTYNTISYSSPNFTIQLDDVTVTTGSYVADYTNLNSGLATIVLGTGSHTEGNSNRSTGDYSHSEGQSTISIGQSSHSEGVLTKSIGIASHSEGSGTTASGSYSHSEGVGTIASGNTSFIHSTNSVVGGDRSVVLGGQNITGSTDDTVYVPYLNLNYVPTLNNSNTEILSRNSSNGDVEYTPLSAFTSLDTYVTGYTYSPTTNTFTIEQNQGQPNISASFDIVSGLTVNGDLTVTGNTLMNSVSATTMSATTYQNLPIDPDTYVTGYTYSDNIFTIKQNNGQPDLTSTIDAVTGWTVNGILTVTGNTSMSSVTASTVTIQNVTGTPSIPISLDSSGKIVSGSTSANLGRTLFVSISGNNSTAIVGDINKPWADVFTAMSASTSGDTIHVFPQTIILDNTTGPISTVYSNKYNLWKDGVTYYWEAGCKVIILNDINHSGLALFRPNGVVNESCKTIGYLEYEQYSTAGAPAGGTVYYFQGTTIGLDVGYTFYSQTKSQTSYCSGLVSIDRTSASVNTTANITIISDYQKHNFTANMSGGGQTENMTGGDCDTILYYNVKKREGSNLGSFRLNGNMSRVTVNIVGDVLIQNNFPTTRNQIMWTIITLGTNAVINVNIGKIYYSTTNATANGSILYDNAAAGGVTYNFTGDLIPATTSTNTSVLFELGSIGNVLNYNGNITTNTTSGIGNSIAYVRNTSAVINIKGDINYIGTGVTTNYVFKTNFGGTVNYNGKVSGNFANPIATCLTGIININNSFIQSFISGNASSVMLNGGSTLGTVRINNSYIEMKNNVNAISNGSYVKGLISNSVIVNSGSANTLENTTAFGSLQLLNSTVISSGTSINYTSTSPVTSSSSVTNTVYSINTLNGIISTITDITY